MAGKLQPLSTLITPTSCLSWAWNLKPPPSLPHYQKLNDLTHCHHQTQNAPYEVALRCCTTEATMSPHPEPQALQGCQHLSVGIPSTNRFKRCANLVRVQFSHRMRRDWLQTPLDWNPWEAHKWKRSCRGQSVWAMIACRHWLPTRPSPQPAHECHSQFQIPGKRDGIQCLDSRASHLGASRWPSAAFVPPVSAFLPEFGQILNFAFAAHSAAVKQLAFPASGPPSSLETPSRTDHTVERNQLKISLAHVTSIPSRTVVWLPH